MRKTAKKHLKSEHTEVYEYSKSPWPAFERGYGAVLEVAEEAAREGMVGLDLEFNPSTGRPHIVGVASRKRSAAARWQDDLVDRALTAARGVAIAGHSVLTADKPVVEGALGIKTSLDQWEDSMLRGYLCNSDWCSAPGKEEDDDDKGSLGLMNLWTMGSYYTGLPQWKTCRGSKCFGPCPEHDEEWYCAVDSWAGLEVVYKTRAEMARRGVSEELYRDLKRLTLYCDAMQKQGIAVDREMIERLETGIQEKKADLFPTEYRLRTERCKKPQKFWLTPFNPNSPKDILRWAKDAGIELAAKKGSPTSAQTIRAALEKILKRLRVEFEVDRKSGILSIVSEGSIPEDVEYLYRLDQYKRSGKGLKSWFDERYIDFDNLIHPRFIVTGTATGRLASANPNFQNVPKRGFGSLVRAAIVPRHKDLEIWKADKGQLELRVVLFYAGAEQPPNDAFTWLVQKAGDRFNAAADRFAMKPRDIAKSLAHAGNYGEGLVLLTEDDLKTTRRQMEIKAGALLVFDGRGGRPEWVYRGRYVAFTGANLAERLFGDKSYENRKNALDLQEIYFSAFPSIRRWHMRVAQEVEKTRAIRSHTGRAMELYGSPEDDLKLALAFLGQGGGADEVQEAMLRYDDLGRIALIQVHDELVFEGPREASDAEVFRFFEPFCEPSKRFGDWRFPIEISRGANWCGASEANPEGLRVVTL